MTTTQTEPTLLSRILDESYGPGAWHGADLKAALADVSAGLAFWRPRPGRHNIAEIALHHAYCARSVRGQLAGIEPEAFVLPGEDWFVVEAGSPIDWPAIRAAVESEQERLARTVTAADTGSSPLGEAERLNLTLGITCHAIYHAGQIQLIKRMHGE